MLLIPWLRCKASDWNTQIPGFCVGLGNLDSLTICQACMGSNNVADQLLQMNVRQSHLNLLAISQMYSTSRAAVCTQSGTHTHLPFARRCCSRARSSRAQQLHSNVLQQASSAILLLCLVLAPVIANGLGEVCFQSA